MKIAVISSTIRIGRLSHRASIAITNLLKTKDNLEVDLVDLAEFDIPVFTELLSRHPNPPADLKNVSQRLMKADGIIFVSPEYNGGYSPALKNLVDFLGKAEFSKKPIGVVSVSSGAMGGIRGALQMQQLILALFGFPIPNMLLVPEVQKKFNESGEVIDPLFQTKIDAFLVEYLWFANAIVKAKQHN